MLSRKDLLGLGASTLHCEDASYGRIPGVPAAFSSATSYDKLAMPIIIIAGEEDRIIDIDEQSARLHGEVKQSKMHRIVGAGHMVQQSATADVMAAIDEAAAETPH
jgi:pimeloyl-ACP methyl ester carboxylesterase